MAAKRRASMSPEEFADNLTKEMDKELGNGLGEDEEATPIYDEETDKVIKKSE
jgi:hypothetical protein